MTYNAVVIDWMCCPDCGCNVMRAEAMTAAGEPTGAMECTCCGFSVLDNHGASEQIYEDWGRICARLGHEWHVHAFLPNNKTLSVCIWCGKQVIT